MISDMRFKGRRTGAVYDMRGSEFHKGMTSTKTYVHRTWYWYKESKGLSSEGIWGMGGGTWGWEVKLEEK
jgi:hypothetical protein